MAMTARRFFGWTSFLLAILIGCAAWGMLSVLAARPGLAPIYDLSPQQQLTLSPDTRELLASVRGGQTRLEFHTFFEPLGGARPTSEGMQKVLQIRTTIQSLTRDLLRLYERLGGDSVTVTHHDLLREVETTREAAQDFALSKINTLVVRYGRRSKVLSLDDDLARIDIPGRGTPTPGGRPALPLMDQYKGEEALSSAIKSLMVEGTPKVYFLTGYQEPSIRDATGDSYSELVGKLSDEGFVVQQLNLATTGEIPADAAVLALVEPRYEITEATAGILFAWLQRGGRLFINLSYAHRPAEWNPTLAPLARLLGVEIGQDLVCTLIPDPRMPGSAGRSGVPQVANLQITELNPNHPITRPLAIRNRPVQMNIAREIKLAAATVPVGVTADLSLLRTGTWSWIETRVPQPGGTFEVDHIAPDHQEAFEPRTVGAAFDITPTEGDRPGAVVLLTGVVFPNAARNINGDLALNIFQYLAERKALIGVRGDKYVSRRLEAVPQQLERVSNLLLIGVPGGLALLALIVLLFRSRA